MLPWLQKEYDRLTLEQKLGRLAGLPANWDGEGSKSVSFTALQIAEAMIRPPQIVPCSDGGVQLEWHENGYDIELVLGPHGTVDIEITPADV